MAARAFVITFVFVASLGICTGDTCLRTPVPTAKTPCNSDYNCSFNGHCGNDGTCACFSQWKGPHCEVMNLIPTARSAGYQPVMNASAPVGFRNATTWGGQAIRHDDGVYHMWAAQMSNNCGIWAWGQNSEVWHAVSDNPYGPYNKVGPAITPEEAHEPRVARAPTGEYVMWYTSGPHGPGGPGLSRGGRPCDCRSPSGIEACEYQALLPAMPTFMSWAPHPNGPWSKARLVTAARGNPPKFTGDTNFAAIIEPDGSVLGVGRHQVYHCTHWNDTDSCTVSESHGMVGEDPFIYRDPRNPTKVLHMLRHWGRNTGNWTGNNGAHQFSLDDGLTWHTFGRLAYPCFATFEDGSSAGFMMRERPALVFDKDGHTPLALTNGAAPGPYTGSGRGDKNDYSYTLLQKLNQN